MSTVQSLQIVPAVGASALTPEQKRFNNLLRQIEQARRTLAAWRDNIPRYLQAHTKAIVPLLQTLSARRRDFAFALDRALHEPGWTKNERATLRELICDFAAEILEGQDEDNEDADVKALFDKHAEVDFDTEQQESRKAMKGMVEAMTGLDLGDDDIASEEDLFKRMQEEMARHAGDAERSPDVPRRNRRKGAAQQRRETEAQQAMQSLREVFRKLASALHPDRETDPVERAAKTALMQKVNQAYAANDLLTLLELQLEIEQVDAGHIASAGAQRLKHYNKVLAEQLGELKAEIAREETRFQLDYAVGIGWSVSPTKLGALVDQNVKQLRGELAMLEKDMRTLADKATAKRWLKRVRQQRRDADIDDFFF